ncbi:MAG TPA: MarR family transcriptional regulator [Actinomycetota bacterium]|nr:MarR family transcriptional regulator [Actinomycetota bacterium]
MPKQTRTRERAALIDRFFDLKLGLERRFRAPLPPELRSELQSVTLHQLEVLGVLKHGSMRMRDLARELDVSEPAATAIADRLVRHGLVERQDDPNDRRTVRLELSARARNLLERVEAARRAAMLEVFEVISEEQLRSLIDVFETLAAEPAATPVHEHGEGAA